MHELDGFINHNNIKIIKNNEEIIAEVNLSECSLNPFGIAHGGLIFGLGDTIMGIIIFNEGLKAVTLNSTINFLKPGNGKKIIGKGSIIKKGKSTVVTEAKIYDDNNNLIAIMSATYFVK